MRRAGVVLSSALLLTAVATIRSFATDAEVRAGNQLEAYYDTKLEESLVDDRLDLDVRWNRFSAGIVFLSHSPSNHLLLDPNKFGPHQEGIRKRWVTAAHGPVEVRLGDSYASFGSGLVLRIYEDQAVDFDNVLDGAHVQAALGGLTLEGIAGTNSYGDARTVVKGLSGRYEVGRGWLVGVNGALIDSVEGAIPKPGRDGLASVQASGMLPGGVSVISEYAVRHYRPEREGRTSPADGHAAYASASAGFGPVNLFLEGKDLLRFKHAYTIPPTAVRQHTSTLLNRGSHVPNIRLNDERGFQAEVILSPARDLLVTGNYSASEARHAALPAWEMLGELEADWLGSHWTLRAAETEEKVREARDRVFYERITFGGDWLADVGRGWTLDLGYETQGIQQQDLAAAAYELPLEYRDNIASITVGRTPRHSWGATIEWTDNPTAETDSWVWVDWNIRLGLLGQLTISGGALRGGQVCSGGVCKIVDPFEGGRVELLTNF